MGRQLRAYLPAQALIITFALSGAASGDVNVIAMVGDPIPGTSDLLTPGTVTTGGNLALLALNDHRQIAFRATPSSLAVAGWSQPGLSIYRGDVNGFEEIARPGDSSPDGNGTYGHVYFHSLNDAGSILFLAEFTTPDDQFSGDSGFYRASGSTVVQMARTGDVAPDGNGSIPKWTGFVTFGGTVFNNMGDFIYSVQLGGTVGGTTDQYAVLKSNGVQSTQIVRAGNTLPGSSDVLEAVSTSAINNVGQTAFFATIAGVTGRILYRTDGASFNEIVRYDQSSPSGDGTLLQFSNFAFNDAGQAAFYTTVVIDPNDTSTWRRALFRADDISLIEIARNGDPSPDSNGIINLPYEIIPTFNNHGQIAFYAMLSGTSCGSTDNVSLFRGDESGLTQITRRGQLAPNGNGRLSLSGYGSPVMNDFGQIAFRAGLTDTSGGASDDGGIFLWNDQSGLHELFRKADPLFGSSIVQLSSPALNNAGQIAFGFELADGRKGIAIWSIPEPAALSLFCIGALIQIGLLRQQRHS